MARIISAIVAFFMFALVAQIEAAPIEARQIGNLTCNVARLRIVGALASASSNVNKISTADAATASAVADAKDGLSSANAGIKTIAGAIITLQKAPATARDQVEAGLLKTQGALQSITTFVFPSIIP
ncbi:hypothetical protein ONZ45_g16977 [Pleurotus djamor]|nr:hypothetical protein ONZ45_g16977 [Pleurotus djamor]